MQTWINLDIWLRMTFSAMYQKCFPLPSVCDSVCLFLKEKRKKKEYIIQVVCDNIPVIVNWRFLVSFTSVMNKRKPTLVMSGF